MKQLLFMSLLLLQLFATHGQISLKLEKIAEGFTQPVDIASAGDNRLFIVEKDGKIKILQADGQINEAPFLDIDDRVRSNGSLGGEQGLLGLAFHPDYASNGYFYVNYTEGSGNTIIARYKVSAGDPDKADKNSEKILLTVDQPDAAHNAGDLNFGPKDGYLYIVLGDGGFGGDPNNSAQDLGSLLGKVLRIDVDGGDPYAIPPDNPFVQQSGAEDEIWALGLRNPWRFSFDRLTGDLWIGDVGQENWEEIDYQPAGSPGGENYGWRCYEGNATYDLSECEDDDNTQPPVWAYTSELPTGCSVNGGFVYRGSGYPLLYGLYLYSDYCSGKIWALQKDGSGEWINEELYPGTEFQFVTMGEDRQGELYLASILGTIYRITEETVNQTNEALARNGIRLSPNPFADELKLEAELISAGTYQMQLLNVQGQLIWEQTTFLDKQVNTAVDTKDLATGIYFFVLSHRGVRNVVRVVKQ